MTHVRQASLRSGRPLWLDGQPSPRSSYQALTGRHETDVVVVGGGITGALTALAFAEAGVSVHVVEAARIGRGWQESTRRIIDCFASSDCDDH